MELFEGKSNTEILISGAFLTGGLLPGVGILPAIVAQTDILGLTTINLIAGGTLAGLALPMAAEIGHRCILAAGGRALPSNMTPVYGYPERLALRDKLPREVNLGGMIYTEEDLYHNTLVTGSLGSGKTSCILMPGIEQLINIYRENDEDPLTKNPYAKMGIFSADVKGEFWEPIALFMHRAGRNVFRDVRIIRVRPNYPVVKFYDPDSKDRRYFYLNAMEASGGCSDAGKLASQLKDENDESIPWNIFSEDERTIEEYGETIRNHTFTVDDPTKFRFLGWRQIGNKLFRVHHHAEDGSEVYLKDAKGKYITTTIPKRLKFVKVVYVSNQMRRNIVRNNLPSGEAAMRLAKIAEMVQKEGGKGGGNDNPYFSEAAKRLITNILELNKVLYPEKQCDAGYIYYMTVNKEGVAKEVAVLDEFIKRLKIEVETLSDEEKEAKSGMLLRAQSVREFFASDWKEVEQKTKSIVGTVVANMFQPFTSDPWLKESFCTEDSYGFEEMVKYGRAFLFVPGSKYENMGRIIGTELKVDQQSIVLARMDLAHMGEDRVQLVTIDEYQRYAQGGSSTMGDDNYTALARQAKSIFIAATQSFAWLETVLGRETTRALTQNFTNRIALQNNDEPTNKIMSDLCGTIEKETGYQEEQDIRFSNMVDKNNSGKISATRSQDRRPRFRPDQFVNLNKLESISFNKGRQNIWEKVVRHQNQWHWIGGPEGKAKKNHFIWWYFQGEIESCVEDEEKFWFFDHDRPDNSEGKGTVPQFKNSNYIETPYPEGYKPRHKRAKKRKAVAPDSVQPNDKPASQSAGGSEPKQASQKTEGAQHKATATSNIPSNSTNPLAGSKITLTHDISKIDQQARKAKQETSEKKKSFVVGKDTKESPTRPITKGEADDFISRKFHVSNIIDSLGDFFGCDNKGDPISVANELLNAKAGNDPKTAGIKGAIGEKGSVSFRPEHIDRIKDSVPVPDVMDKPSAIDETTKRFAVTKPKNSPATDKRIQDQIQNPAERPKNESLYSDIY